MTRIAIWLFIAVNVIVGIAGALWGFIENPAAVFGDLK